MEPQPLLHPNLAELYRQKVAALHERWRTRRRATKPSSLIRSLIERVVLMPVDGDLRIDLYGELAGISARASTANCPAGTGRLWSK
jgi:site-specific DNA recombinase